MTDEKLSKLFHDLKNDLAAMTALLNLHRLYKDKIDSEELLNRLTERQLVISTAYEKLYQEGDFPNISLRVFINDLLQRELRGLGKYQEGVVIEQDVTDIKLPIKRAMPFAQILTELISNSYRHAFKDSDGEHRIEFRINEKDEYTCFEYSDNGCGIPEDINPTKAKTLGMQFIFSLSKQLGGKPEFMAVEPGSGMKFTLQC